MAQKVYSGGNASLLVVGTGSGPEGSRPTVNIRRLQGRGVEKGFAKEIRHVLPTEGVFHPLLLCQK